MAINPTTPARNRPGRKPSRITVRVGPYDWTVQLVCGAIIDADGDECIGLCDFATATISVADTASPTMRRSTLWHELGHAWHEVFGRNTTYTDCEQIVDFVERGMAGIDWKTLRRIEAVINGPATIPAMNHSRHRIAARKRK